MQCGKCGRELEPGTVECPLCDQEPKVTVLSPNEREAFDGVTIHQEAGNRRGREEQAGPQYQRRIFVRQVRLSGGGSSLLSKILWGLLALAFMAALFFVALPLIAVALALIALVAFFRRW